MRDHGLTRLRGLTSDVRVGDPWEEFGFGYDEEGGVGPTPTDTGSILGVVVLGASGDST